MRCAVAGFFGLLILVAPVCRGQALPTANAPGSVEIKLPSGINSESIFIRYVLAGDDFGSWVQPRAGVSSYIIRAIHDGQAATGIKALMYAPGCAIQTLDVRVSPSSNQQYDFICRPLGSVSITGAVARTDRLHGRDVKLQVSYVARWAQEFLGLGDGVVTSIPMGDVASLSPDGRFQVSVPDLLQDALAGAPDHPGEFRIWARDKTTNNAIAELIAAGPEAIRTHMGGLKIRSGYPSETVFSPCAVNPPLHGAYGFALRSSDACDR